MGIVEAQCVISKPLPTVVSESFIRLNECSKGSAESSVTERYSAAHCEF